MMLRRLRRDSWLAICLVLALVVVMFIGAARQQRKVAPPLSSTSNQPDGARALWLWLETLGYVVDLQTLETFAIPEQTNLTLVLEPTQFIQAHEWRTIDDWVEQGGVLLIAGDAYLISSWADHYEFERNAWRTEQPTSTLHIQHPLFVSPPLSEHPSALPNAGSLTSTRTDVVVHVATAEGPVIVSFAQGQGQVILSVTAYPFSNLGLQSQGVPPLVLNLFNLAGAPRRAWFDEWHHGVRGQGGAATPVGIDNWLRNTTAGRAILLALLVVFLALVLQGRPFGRPVPLPQKTLRRTPLEYVTAIANLNRRAGYQAAILQDYRLRLKRELGRRYRLDPALPDPAFIEQLAAYNPDLDQAALHQLLSRLASPGVNEQQMVQLAAEVARWVKT